MHYSYKHRCRKILNVEWKKQIAEKYKHYEIKQNFKTREN